MTLVSEDGTMKSEADLIAIFEQKGVNLNPGQPIINSCAIGIGACIVDLGLKLSGVPEDKSRFYDGSWSEYGSVEQPNFDQ
tara:strand:- start:115 stop:357 length:243 start_codon:yes stop_codon:yes gene_type:complete